VAAATATVALMAIADISGRGLEVDTRRSDKGVSLMEGVWASLAGVREPDGVPESSSAPTSGHLPDALPFPLHNGFLNKRNF
jgi:hypothetical protein